MNSYVQYLFSIAINLILIFLHVYLSGFTVATIIILILVYLISILFSFWIYKNKNKKKSVELIVGVLLILSVMYSLLLAESWLILSMCISVIVIVFSISMHYFDWDTTLSSR